MRQSKDAALGVIAPEAAYANQWYEQGAAANPLAGDPSGRYIPGSMQQPIPAASAFSSDRNRIVLGTRDGVTPDRSQSDEYRAQLAQYGKLSKAGKQEEAEKLGMEIWQQKYGKTAMGRPGGAVGTFNPLMERTFGYQTGEAPGQRVMAPDEQTMMGDLGSRAQSEGGHTMGAFNPAGFSGAANAVPAPWNTQGQAVSAPYTEAMSKAFDKTNPMNLVSQQPIEMNNEIGTRVQDFLKRRGQ
jgi:hypothetical protein